jgi:signal transduction histidine kinase
VRRLLRITIVLTGLLCPAVCLAADPLPRSVLVLDATEPNSPWGIEFRAVPRSVLSVDAAADQVHLEQAILNLATNAMDAMQACATGTRLMTVHGALVGDSEPNGVFETFYTTKQQGTGLGLSIVRTIVESYGGKIWAENRRAVGATFRFTLPLARARAA